MPKCREFSLVLFRSAPSHWQAAASLTSTTGSPPARAPGKCAASWLGPPGAAHWPVFTIRGQRWAQAVRLLHDGSLEATDRAVRWTPEAGRDWSRYAAWLTRKSVHPT